MNTPEANRPSPDAVAPTVQFLYSPSGRIAGETFPMTSPAVEAFINGKIDVKQYFAQCAAETAANQRLRHFMYGNQPPEFMPKVQRLARRHGWLRNVLKVL
jgi:hypothetical protein